MRTFTPEQITEAYVNADQRVITGMGRVNIDATLVGLRQQYNLALDKLDSVRAAIDFVLVGLISARELSTEIKALFPKDHQTIITRLNTDIFKPVLEYVRSTQPVFEPAQPQQPVSGVPNKTPQPAINDVDPLKASNIHIIDEKQAPSVAQISQKTSPSVDIAIPIKPGFEPPTPVGSSPQNTAGPDPYQEPID